MIPSIKDMNIIFESEKIKCTSLPASIKNSETEYTDNSGKTIKAHFNTPVTEKFHQRTMNIGAGSGFKGMNIVN